MGLNFKHLVLRTGFKLFSVLNLNFLSIYINVLNLGSLLNYLPGK